MQITDINCMMGVWPSRQRHYKDICDLLLDLDRYRFSDCVAFHSMSFWSPEKGNLLIKQVSEKSSGRIKPCYILQPNLGNSGVPSEMELYVRLKKEKPVAVRLYPNSKQFRADHFYCGELLEIINELKLPVIFEADQTPAYEYLPVLAKSYSRIKFIILRRGFRESGYIIPLLKKLNNVYFDTSIMVDTGIIEEIVNKYGSERLLFGSGLPFFPPEGALSLILYARIGNKDRENILFGNWLKIEEEIQCE